MVIRYGILMIRSSRFEGAEVAGGFAFSFIDYTHRRDIF